MRLGGVVGAEYDSEGANSDDDHETLANADLFADLFTAVNSTGFGGQEEFA